MSKNIIVRKIANASLIFLISASGGVRATEEGIKKEGGEGASRPLKSQPKYLIGGSSKLRDQIHARVQKILKGFRDNMNAYYERTGNPKRIEMEWGESEEAEMASITGSGHDSRSPHGLDRDSLINTTGANGRLAGGSTGVKGSSSSGDVDMSTLFGTKGEGDNTKKPKRKTKDVEANLGSSRKSKKDNQVRLDSEASDEGEKAEGREEDKRTNDEGTSTHGDGFDPISKLGKTSTGGDNTSSNTTAGPSQPTLVMTGLSGEGEKAEETKKNKNATEDGINISGESKKSKKKAKKETGSSKDKANDKETDVIDPVKVLTQEELGEVFKAQWKDQDITQASACFYELYEISEVTSANLTNVISKIDCIQIFQKNNIKDTPSIKDITRYLACLYTILCRESNTFSEDSLLNFDLFKKRAIAEYVKVKGDNLVDCNSIGILKIDDFEDTSTLGWFKDVAAKNSSFSSPPPSPIKKINNATNTASRKTISTQPSKKKYFTDLELYKQGKAIPFSEEFLKGQTIMVIIFDEIKEAGSKTLVSGAYPYTFKK